MNNAALVDRIAKILFPGCPRLVRYHKMRLLYVGVFLGLFCAFIVGLLFWLSNKYHL